MLMCFGEVGDHDLTFFPIVGKPPDRATPKRLRLAALKGLPLRATPEGIEPLDEDKPHRYFVLWGRFARAEPAALFAAFVAAGLRRTLAAILPTRLEVS